MSTYTTLKYIEKDQIATIYFARPEVHNALNNIMIEEIISIFKEIENNPSIRIVILRGEGKSFCSGADLSWMKKSFTLTPEENLKECETLAQLFSTIYSSSKVVIAAIHGNAYGGAIGIIATCDLAYCVNNAKFVLSEAKLGVVAATITPYLLLKINHSQLKELIFTAKLFDGPNAMELNLVNNSYDSEEKLDLELDKITTQILQNGTQAIIESKKLLNKLVLNNISSFKDSLPQLLAKTRVSPEAKEGFTAFLEKRKPDWNK